MTYLNRGGSMGSFCTSTILMILCLAPELKATPCWDGVYLKHTWHQKFKKIHHIQHKQEFPMIGNSNLTNLNDSQSKWLWAWQQYLIYWAGACFSACRTGMAADILLETSLDKACLVFSVVSSIASSSGRCRSGSSSSIIFGTKSPGREWIT